MKKKVVSIILVGSMVVSLGAMAGCNNSTESANNEETTEKEETTTEDYDLSDLGDESYTLTVTSHDPEDSATGTFLTNWADSIEEASDGHLDIEIYPGAVLADATETIDAINDGTADIGWGAQSFYSDMFPVTEVFMLPMIEIESAKQGSEAIWDFYNSTDYMEDEYSDYHVLLLHSNCQSPISLLKKQVEEVSEFEGMHIRVNTGPPTSFIQDLGATSVAIPINNLHDAASSSLDGFITDWHAISVYKLDEVIKYYLDENVGISTYFLLMNKDSYESLPDVLQKILDDKSAEAIQYTGAWDDVAETIKAQVEEEGKIYTLSEEEHAKLENIAQETIDQWIIKMDELGLDGQAIYADAVECIDKAK